MKTIKDSAVLNALVELQRANEEVDQRAGQHRVAITRQRTAIDRLTEIRVAEENWKFEDDAPYGLCPLCGAKGVSRERRPDGNDRCASGHVYPSKHAKMEEPEDQ